MSAVQFQNLVSDKFLKKRVFAFFDLIDHSPHTRIAKTPKNFTKTKLHKVGNLVSTVNVFKMQKLQD